MISIIIWLLRVTYRILSLLTTTNLCHLFCKLLNILNITPNHPHRIKTNTFGDSSCFNHTQDLNEYKLLMQATCLHHPALLQPSPWQTYNATAASKDLKHTQDLSEYQLLTQATCLQHPASLLPSPWQTYNATAASEDLKSIHLTQATCLQHPASLLPSPWQIYNAFAASKDLKPSTLHPFDSDSFQIKIDNCASKCITNCIEDFVAPPDPISLNILGVGGNIPCTHIGTVKWVIEDDQGHNHSFNIPGTIFAPQAPHRLLSPQHWSQAANDNYPNPNGTWCGTYANHIQLHWSQCQYTCTVPLDVSTNTATLYTAAGFICAKTLLTSLQQPTLISYQLRKKTPNGLMKFTPTQPQTQNLTWRCQKPPIHN
jgi:hypothetical protein